MTRPKKLALLPEGTPFDVDIEESLSRPTVSPEQRTKDIGLWNVYADWLEDEGESELSAFVRKYAATTLEIVRRCNRYLNGVWKAFTPDRWSVRLTHYEMEKRAHQPDQYDLHVALHAPRYDWSYSSFSALVTNYDKYYDSMSEARMKCDRRQRLAFMIQLSSMFVLIENTLPKQANKLKGN